MTTYEILIPADVAEKCFLSEALYWRAFGRIPLESYSTEGPYRDTMDVYETTSAPIPDDLHLSVEECLYAGLPPDPYVDAINEGIPYDADYYEKELDDCLKAGDASNLLLSFFKSQLEKARKFQEENDDWNTRYDVYVDEFKTELCLDLRRGNLVAFGRMLPDPDPAKSQAELGAKDLWFDSLETVAVPSKAWVSPDIDWSDGAIYGPHASYIWIYLSVADLLERYPPQTLIKPGAAYQIGGSVAVAGYQPPKQAKASGRGRPPLPWDDFHVEVARLYADGEMPSKKEAAIALLREWFQEHKQKDVSRSAIGAKLKPYFDTIGRK